MSSMAREQTYLRVKRRRDEDPPSTIRLELLGGWNLPGQQRTDGNEDENFNSAANANSIDGAPSGENSNTSRSSHGFSLRSLSATTIADSRHSNLSTSTSQTQAFSNVRRTTTSAAIWKRVEVLEGDAILSANSTGGFGGSKRCRVVDAILEGDGPTSKRRKLTVLGEAKPEDAKPKPPKKSNIYRVLDPVTRLVDDSLDMVHAGDRPVAEHYVFVTTDPRLATNARSWLMHRNRGGTLLHACAHWNDVETAHALLQQNLPGMADAVDDDDKTPYEIAHLCSHESMVGMLEAFGADTTNFVYDMFVPEEIPVEATTTSEEWDPLNKSSILDSATASGEKASKASGMQQQPLDLAMLDTSRLLELQGGVGYWTEDGELILEVEAHHMMGVTAEFGHDSDEEHNEDDIDSNCEDYGGNDYPDDESWDEEFLHEEPEIDDDSYGCYGE